MTINTIAAVIPLYNKEPYVARAIASVLAQTRPVEEIIVVDDASTDGSLEQIKAFQDPRIRILRRTDPRQRGPSETRNLGILSATSRWIALLDADDRWHENFIEESERLMAQASERVAFLFTGWERISPDGVVARDAYSLPLRRPVVQTAGSRKLRFLMARSWRLLRVSFRCRYTPRHIARSWSVSGALPSRGRQRDVGSGACNNRRAQLIPRMQFILPRHTRCNDQNN